MIQTSDLNQKQNISDCPYGLDFINQLRPVKFQFINGSAGRYHVSYIAQEVKQLLDDNSIPTSQFAGYIYTPEQDIIDTSDNVIGQTEECHGLRMNEFLPIHTKAIQELCDLVQNLTSRIEALEEQLL